MSSSTKHSGYLFPILAICCGIVGTAILCLGCNPYSMIQCPAIGYSPAEAVVIDQTVTNHTCLSSTCYDSYVTFKYNDERECTLKTATDQSSKNDAINALDKYQLSNTYYLFVRDSDRDSCFEDWHVYYYWKMGVGFMCLPFIVAIIYAIGYCLYSSPAMWKKFYHHSQYSSSGQPDGEIEILEDANFVVISDEERMRRILEANKIKQTEADTNGNKDKDIESSNEIDRMSVAKTDIGVTNCQVDNVLKGFWIFG